MVRKTGYELMTGLLLLILIIATCIDISFLKFFLIVAAVAFLLAKVTQAPVFFGSFSIAGVIVLVTFFAIISEGLPTDYELLIIIIGISGSLFPFSISEAWHRT
jgi:membrane-bound ClpP family serine protease